MAGYYTVKRTAPDGGELLARPFSADTDAHAQTIADSLATLFQCALTLIGGGLSSPYTANKGSQGSTVNCPSGPSAY